MAAWCNFMSNSRCLRACWEAPMSAHHRGAVRETPAELLKPCGGCRSTAHHVRSVLPLSAMTWLWNAPRCPNRTLRQGTLCLQLASVSWCQRAKTVYTLFLRRATRQVPRQSASQEHIQISCLLLNATVVHCSCHIQGCSKNDVPLDGCRGSLHLLEQHRVSNDPCSRANLPARLI